MISLLAMALEWAWKGDSPGKRAAGLCLGAALPAAALGLALLAAWGLCDPFVAVLDLGAAVAVTARAYKREKDQRSL